MTTSMKRPASARNGSAEEAELRGLLEAWAHAVRRLDLEGVIAQHAKDVVYFDVPPPTQLRGSRAYKDSWPPFFAHIGETGQFDLDELTITAGADVGFAHAILVVRGESEASPGRVRLTVGFRKLDGEWTITHEHHSVPYEQAR